jgi:DNA adenine methylase
VTILASSEALQPLLKWPGGKRFLLPYLLRVTPAKFNRYYEPFVGSGALFFALRPRQSMLSDLNQDLIDCYLAVRDNAADIVKFLETLPNTESDYYRIRDDWTPSSRVELAAQFIYLTSLSFNGIHRTNKSGKFNVPYGRRSMVNPCHPERIQAVSRALRRCTLECADFERVVLVARRGDLVYLDPPYTVAHSNNGFVRYNARIFAWADQIRLARTARLLADRGVHVVVSNADHSSITELYEGFRSMLIQRSSRIAASSAKRGPVTECLFYTGF